MEVIVELAGAVLREISEALFRVVFGQIGRFVGFIYHRIHQTVRWNLNSDFLATPVTMLLMLALGGTIFFVSVKAVQWMIA